MIPKTIHYSWFGHNSKPRLVQKCIESWKAHCPDYEIIEWNEENYDISDGPLYIRQAYEAKKWAFVTDYVRLDVVNRYGGIYFDTDVELLRNLDGFLNYDAFFGFEDGIHINTGLGFGAKKGLRLLSELMEDYHSLEVDGYSVFDTPCPVLNTEVFLRHGLIQNDSYQVLDGEIHILPKRVLCPIDFQTGRKRITRDTIAIHWFAGSWKSDEEKSRNARIQLFNRFFGEKLVSNTQGIYNSVRIEGLFCYLTKRIKKYTIDRKN